MFAKEDTITKKVSMATALIVAVTGLIAAWTAFVKVHNPPPPEEKKAKKVYEVLREKVEYQDMVIRDTRDKIRDLEMKLWMSAQMGRAVPYEHLAADEYPEEAAEEPRPRRGSASRSPASVMSDDGLDALEGIMSVEDLPEEPMSASPPVQMQQVADPLMEKSKPLPKKL